MRNAILAAIIGLGLFAGKGIAQPQDSTQIKLIGTVEEIEYVAPTPWAPRKFTKLAIKSEKGDIIRAWIPPRWSAYIRVRKGDKIELQGFSFNGEILVGYVNNLTTKESFKTLGPCGYGPPWYWRNSRRW